MLQLAWFPYVADLSINITKVPSLLSINVFSHFCEKFKYPTINYHKLLFVSYHLSAQIRKIDKFSSFPLVLFSTFKNLVEIETGIKQSCNKMKILQLTEQPQWIHCCVFMWSCNTDNGSCSWNAKDFHFKFKWGPELFFTHLLAWNMKRRPEKQSGPVRKLIFTSSPSLSSHF